MRPEIVTDVRENTRLRPLMTLSVEVGVVCEIGGPSGATRRMAPIRGGAFWGDRLSGCVLSGGADWQTIQGDDAVIIDADVVLQTGDGVAIAMHYGGIRHGPADVMARLGRGEIVEPSAYYFRIQPSFTTSAPAYEWLNRVLFVGIGSRLPGGPVYRIFEVL